jgi:hypothetical protein
MSAQVTEVLSRVSVPVWLLDVDGVLNVPKPGWSAPPRRSTAYAEGVAWGMRWAPKLVTRIRELHGAGVVEVRWCTTWCPWADQLERMMGLPALQRSLPDDVARGPSLPRAGAKLAVAFAVLNEEGRRLVWTDDDAIPVQGRDDRRALEADGRALLIAPPYARGLQPAHLDEIERWLGE